MTPFISKMVVMPFERLYRDFPPTVRIETTNRCNASCLTCPREKMTRKAGVMDMGLYEKIIRECTEMGLRCVHLHNFGEPLLDHHLSARIRMAKGLGISRVKIFSNGSLLTHEKAVDLIESGLDEIKISLDAYTRETFERIRRNLRFEAVMENVSRLIRLRDESPGKKPMITVVFVRSDENRDEERAFVDKWKGEADRISIDRPHNWGINHFATVRKAGIRKPCLRIWNTLTILWNGDISLCCLDYDGQAIIGDANDERIQDVWKGERLREIRHHHIQAQLKDIPICENCSKSRI